MGDWKDTTGLSDSTDVAKIYVREDIKEEWKEEAAEHNRSLSNHLFYLVREARILRNEGVMNPTLSASSEEVEQSNGGEELSEKVSELESRMEELKQVDAEGAPVESDLVDRELTQQVLTEDCTPLDELVDILLEYPEFRNRVRSDLKQSLFQLGADKEADYVRGHGWRRES